MRQDWATRCAVPGAGRPENRVTAMSKLPQKKCTGLTLPRNGARNCFSKPIHLQQDAPEPVGVFGVVGRMCPVLVERDRVRDLDRHGPDVGFQTKAAQPAHHLGMEVGDASWRERDGFDRTSTGLDLQPMVDEIEIDLKTARAVRDQRGGQASAGHVQRNVPPMVDRRRVREPDLADDLRPKMQRGTGVRPFRERQFGPVCRSSVASLG